MAGGASEDNDDGMISGINVTPFVDISLVLLIIFMVTAKYIVSQPSIPVDLPHAASGTQQVISSTVQVSVDHAGAIFVEARPVNEAQLRALMQERHTANADVRAVIAADRAVPHGRVVQVIDIIRLAGVTKFAIQTEMPTNIESGAH
jgi:biopolymer transport protein ExbD